MSKVLKISILITILLTAFVAFYETGKRAGFRIGSEWALVQADIVAREAGVFMPVSMKDGKFRVVMKQPRGVYRRAWRLADRFEEQWGLKTAGMIAGGKQADL